jgi:PAS domain S-box-containing protein
MELNGNGMSNRLAVPSARHALAMVDGHDRVSFANAAARRLLRVSDGDVLRAAWFAGLAAKARAGEPVRVKLRGGRGQRRQSAICSAELLPDQRGALLLVIDVQVPASRSGSRHVAAGLAASHERFRILAENLRDHAILMVDANGIITSWNASARRITGYKAEQTIGRPLAMLYPADAVAMGEPGVGLGVAAEQGRNEEECWHLRRDGSRVRLNVVTTALQKRDGTVIGYARILRDLTERLAAEDALRRSEEQLRHAQKMEAVGRLAGGIAHDFNNLLTAIRGHAQFILEDLEPQHASRQDAEEIKRSADRAAALTRQLLTFSRRQPIQPTVLDANEVICEMGTLARRLVREDIALSTSLQEKLWPIRADRGHIEQILMNLIVNARDAIRGSGRIRVRTQNVRLSDQYAIAAPHLVPGDYVQIAVSDTGGGMDRALQARVFEPFFTTKPEGQGTGLGLATVYGIVQQSHGHVTCYSEPGRGTTFKVFLPCALVEQVAGDHSSSLDAPEPIRDCTILIAEDDPSVRAFAARVLTGLGYAVLDAPTAEDALQAARAAGDRISLLLTDVVMPDQSGRHLAEQVQHIEPGAATLYMSGFTRDDAVEQGLLEPGAEFLEKPFSPEALAAKVRELVS